MRPGRRQKVSDAEVFAAAQRVMARRGPHELTLADIAEEAGVTAGRLVQRFGSKRALLAALSEQFAASAGTVFAGLRAVHRSPWATLRAYADCMAGLAPTPEALLRNLAYLQNDLSDDRLRGHLAANARATRREIEALVEAAVAAGELARGTNPRTLARAVDTAITGSLMTWAIHREGTAAAWLARDLEAVLAPWLSTARAPTARTAKTATTATRRAARTGRRRRRET